MNFPHISIIVPVYNVEHYLEKCLNSLIGQTFTDIEIICVDDGSTDGSAAILADYAARDTRIRVITQKNAGQGAARNRALDVAESPYIMFCDSDDWYSPDMCEKMLAAMEKEPRADLAICGYFTEWEREPEANEPKPWREEVPFAGFHTIDRKVIQECLVGPPYKIYRRELIEKNHIRFPEGMYYEDFYFWFVCAAHAKGLVFVPARLYHYRQRNGSTMHNSLKKKPNQDVDYIRIAECLWGYFKAHSFESLWDGFIAECLSSLLKSAIEYTPDQESKKHITALVRDFVYRECESNTGCMPQFIMKAMAISMGIKSIRFKRFCGLFQIRYSFSQIVYRVCGIPVYRIKYREHRLGWIVLFIPVYSLHASKDPAALQAAQHAYYARLQAPFLRRIDSVYHFSEDSRFRSMLPANIS